MVLQDDRTSVPLPPNLYLLNQNQKFMKRTLHLTVMMLLYESDFSEGMDGWEISGNYTNGNLTYDSENKYLCYRLFGISGTSNFNCMLGKKLDFNKVFYREIQVSFEICCNISNKFYYYANGKLGTVPRSSNNYFTYSGIYSLHSAAASVNIGIVMEPSKFIGSGDIKIKSVRVTGVPLYNGDWTYTTTKMADIQRYSDGCTFKYTFDKATVSLSNSQYLVLTDGDGGMIIRLDNAVIPSNINVEMLRAFHGTIYGTITTENGGPEVINALLDIEQDDNEKGSIVTKEIKEEDYDDHQCELVTMPISSKTYLWDMMEVYGPSRTVTPTVNGFYVTGIVFPNEDGSKRLIMTPHGSKPSTYIAFPDDENCEIDAGCEGYTGIIERPMEKGKWYTLTLPGDYRTSGYTSSDILATFESAENGVLSFKTITTGVVPQGTPMLIKPQRDKTEIWTDIYMDDSSPCIVEGSEYNFVGGFNVMYPKDGSYYLTAGNTIRPLASGGTIKPFRAYFEPATPSAARARAISIDGMTTAIEDIEWGDGNPFLTPTDSRIYNLEGQMVGTNLEQLPKGMYIVNGKKVIK